MDRPPLAADLLLSALPAVGEVRWSARDSAIYNLGIGLGAAAAADPRWLPFVREEEARAFPTMVSVLEDRAAESLFAPRFNIDFAGIVHGEEAIELHRPLRGCGALVAQRRILGLWDKGEGRGAVLQVARTLAEADGTDVATVTSTLMLRGNGGYGGSNEGAPRPLAVPERPADGMVEIATLPEQALLYRLAGDLNPLHVDPQVARAAGFPRPILMGLCSFALAARALVEALGQGDPDSLTALRTRFAGVVFPGETLVVEHWRLDDGEAAFRATVKERAAPALAGGRARFRQAGSVAADMGNRGRPRRAP